MYETKIIYDDQDRMAYLFKALPGTSSNDSEWQIISIQYYPNDSIKRVSYANNNYGFTLKADDYLLYKYTPYFTTSVNPLNNLPAGTVIDFLNTQDFIITGDVPDFLESKEHFNIVDFIVVSINNDILIKGMEYIWESRTAIKLMIPCEKNQGFVINT